MFVNLKIANDELKESLESANVEIENKNKIIANYKMLFEENGNEKETL